MVLANREVFNVTSGACGRDAWDGIAGGEAGVGDAVVAIKYWRNWPKLVPSRAFVTSAKTNLALRLPAAMRLARLLLRRAATSAARSGEKEIRLDKRPALYAGRWREAEKKKENSSSEPDQASGRRQAAARRKCRVEEDNSCVAAQRQASDGLGGDIDERAAVFSMLRQSIVVCLASRAARHSGGASRAKNSTSAIRVLLPEHVVF